MRCRNDAGLATAMVLAFVLIIGTPERLKCGKQIGSYVAGRGRLLAQMLGRIWALPVGSG